MPMDIHITRNGEQHGPYPEATARQLLEEGKLLPADLAWHEGAEGWKPLSEVLGADAQPPATPPPSPAGGIPKRTMAGAAPAEEKSEDSVPDDPDKIHVTRKGEPIGSYPREKAKEFFASGQLLPTDWGWHDGMDDWKPLNEVLSAGESANTGAAHPVTADPMVAGYTTSQKTFACSMECLLTGLILFMIPVVISFSGLSPPALSPDQLAGVLMPKLIGWFLVVPWIGAFGWFLVRNMDDRYTDIREILSKDDGMSLSGRSSEAPAGCGWWGGLLSAAAAAVPVALFAEWRKGRLTDAVKAAWSGFLGIVLNFLLWAPLLYLMYRGLSAGTRFFFKQEKTYSGWIINIFGLLIHLANIYTIVKIFQVIMSSPTT
jgi:hypothetical protein